MAHMSKQTAHSSVSLSKPFLWIERANLVLGGLLSWQRLQLFLPSVSITAKLDTAHPCRKLLYRSVRKKCPGCQTLPYGYWSYTSYTNPY